MRSSTAPDSGDVVLPLRSHSRMASLSYVNPSEVETGSDIISEVMGHMYASGGVCLVAMAPCPSVRECRERRVALAREAVSAGFSRRRRS